MRKDLRRKTAAPAARGNNNEEANSNETIAIDELVTTVQPFPFAVHCTVFEHDGGIGANWEGVMDETRIISAPGSYAMVR